MMNDTPSLAVQSRMCRDAFQPLLGTAFHSGNTNTNVKIQLQRETGNLVVLSERTPSQKPQIGRDKPGHARE
jgi:hypothetical protein